jgi:co-chaperonin GroES (HSP10)
MDQPTTSPVRPRNAWLVVRLDKVPEPKAGELWVPSSQEKRERTGVVLQTGTGRVTKKGKVIPLEAKPGNRVAFFRENFETSQGKQIESILHQLDENIGIIKEESILYFIED